MELKIRPEEISAVIKSRIESFDGKYDLTQVGRVLEVGDGIARVYGLEDAMSGELVYFPKQDIFGMVLNLESN